MFPLEQFVHESDMTQRSEEPVSVQNGAINGRVDTDNSIRIIPRTTGVTVLPTVTSTL